MSIPLDAATMKTWNDLLVEAYSEATGDFKRVIRYSVGLDLYKDITHENQPFRDIVLAVTDRMEALGVSYRLAQKVADDRPHIKVDLEAIFPQITLAPPSAATEIQNVSKAIDIVRSRLRDAGVNSLIATSRRDMEKLQSDLELLRSYKVLHECLHVIQFQLFQLIAKAARTFMSDNDSYDELVAYQSQLQFQLNKAEQAAKSLPDIVGERDVEARWLKELQEAIDGLGRALDFNDSQEATKSVFKLKKILRQEPARLDGLMVVTARRAPLRELISTLSTIQVEGEEQQKSFSEAVSSLQRVLSDLLSRVAEHNQWQNVARSLWLMEETITQPDPDGIKYIWDDIKSDVEELRVTDPGHVWMDKLSNYRNGFEKAYPLMPQPPVPAGARSQFNRFSGAATQQFFHVDAGLEALCGEIVKLKEPLKTLLDEVADV